MKFVKLKLKNFKPYYQTPYKEQEIVFFDNERKDKSVSLNIGQTGHGKTSISEAILWCLFGDGYKRNWGEWVNTLSIEIAEQKGDREVDMSVELEVEIEGDHYRIVRSGEFNIERKGKVSESEIHVICNGEPIKEDPNRFIGKYFLPVELMEYFIFDADDILKKFEENREKTIKDHINKIVGLEKLDDVVSTLERVIELYKDEVYEIEGQIRGDTANKIKGKEKDIQKKKEAVTQLKKEIDNLKTEKKKLFRRGVPSAEEKRFRDLVERRDNLLNEIKELNDKFKEEKDLISNMDLLLLEAVIENAIEKTGKGKTSKEEFEAAVNVVRSSVERDYSGIFFDTKEEDSLIKRGTKISHDELEDFKELSFSGGGGIKADSLKTFAVYKGVCGSLKKKFLDYKKRFDEGDQQLLKVKNQMDLIGETTKNKEVIEKIKNFEKMEEKIDRKERNGEEIENKIEEIEKELKDLRLQLDLENDQKRKIKEINEKKKITQSLLQLSKETRKEFLDSLLSEVNKTASEFLRNIIKDTKRFHSIEIDPDYHFQIKQEKGEPLKESQINRGNLQISLMAFFFGLSKFLGKKIPYVIDDPLLRLDPGHDKRLIEQLSKTEEQLILHMIPGKEYTTDTFKWLNPHINTQNWIYRRMHGTMELISYIENKNAEKIIEFDIDKF